MAAAVAPDLPPQLDVDLREISFGRWENRTFAEAAAEDPSLIGSLGRVEPDFAFPGGETVGDFLRRVRAAADRLIHAEARTVLAVTHGGVDPRDDLPLARPGAAAVRGLRRAVCGLAVIDLFDGKGVLAALERPEPAEDAHG